MKPLLLVANFKSYMTKNEAKNWLEEFVPAYKNLGNIDKKIILCPAFTLLETFKNFLENANISIELGAQNISRLPEGPYTGEVNGAHIKDFANYVIVGHSERRQYGEDESVVEEKARIAKDYSLTSIFCVQGADNKIPEDVSIIAYEPVFAIGSGNPDTPENAEDVAMKMKKLNKDYKVIYGGSVDSANVNSFTKMGGIDGVLVGKASLDVKEFLKLIENA